jgi:putative transposase
MQVHQSYRYELDPNAAQRAALARHAGTARFAWNWALARRKVLLDKYPERKDKRRYTNACAQHREWNAWKVENAPWAYECSKCTAQEAFRNLDKAFRNFYRGRKAGRRVGFPKFKKKGVHDAFRLTGAAHCNPRSVSLPRLGQIRTKEITDLKGCILSATVSRVVDRWFVSFAVKRERPDPKPAGGDVVGIDLGLLTFAVLSDGSKADAPRPLKKLLGGLQQASKSHSRKRKGSKNRRKSALRLARRHYRIRNVRRDFLHKFTTDLAKTKRAIIVEDLCVSGMVKSRSLARSISDSGWSEMRRMLEYKTLWYGSRLIVAPRFFPSSKMCCCCGNIKDEMPLATRVYECEKCGLVIDRDLNAAINLEQYGLVELGEAPSVREFRGDEKVACGGEGADAGFVPDVKPSPVKQEARCGTKSHA